MSNLQSIVPPGELCKLIPAGEFEDTALVWDIHGKFDKWHVEKRVKRSVRFGDYGRMSSPHADIPAPTLEEVLEAIGKVENWDTATITRPIGVNARIVDTALKRWFEVKGINNEEHPDKNLFQSSRQLE